MSVADSAVMQKVQRFGGAMFTPVVLFAFSGLFVAIATIFKNPEIVGSIAAKGTLWWDIWYIFEQGAWTVFNQLPLLFVIGLPIGLAHKQHARACMESFVIYITFNYFIAAMLTVWGPFFGIDYAREAVSGSGLATVANIKTLDLSMLGAIMIAGISVYLHDKLFDVPLPEALGVFRGSSLVVVAGFAAMLPLAFLTCLVWPHVQNAIASLQGFILASGTFGIWLYTFLERILIPTGLHHFIWTPFCLGPAVVDGGAKIYFFQHLSEFADSTRALKEMFPYGGFTLYGMSKMFACPGIALAMYATAKPERKKAVAGLLIPATLVAIFCGVTEPLEFTFLFIAPMLFAIHALLAATLSATVFAFGVVGEFEAGLFDALFLNWIPLFKYHPGTYLTQIGIGLCFTAIYFFVFRYLILRFDFKTPGRTDDASEDKLYTKADYKAREAAMAAAAGAGNDKLSQKAVAFLMALGGKDNIVEVTNCATRLRLKVKDPEKVQPTGVFTDAGAAGLAKNGQSVQVIVGLSVPQVRERFEALLHMDLPDAAAALSASLVAFESGKTIPITEVKDEMFSQRMMGDGIAIWPENGVVVSPADGKVTMVMEGSGHAVGLALENGLEILIHIGIDTVKMQGEGFAPLVKEGDEVRAGDELIRFDIKRIEESGYSPVVILAATNSDQYPRLSFQPGGRADASQTSIATF